MCLRIKLGPHLDVNIHFTPKALMISYYLIIHGRELDLHCRR